MSETFEKILVKDDRLGCITPKVKYQVFKGGQNITCQTYKAISQTAANHVYSVQVPSLETIISREVLWRSTITLKISHPNKPAHEFPVNYGVTDALSAFPLHSLVNVMSATINNNTVTTNVQETLPLLLRMVDPEEFAKYSSMSPTALDFLAYYEDAVEEMAFQIDRSNNTADGIPPVPFLYLHGPDDVEPTGVHERGLRPTGYISHPNNVLSYDMNRPAGTSYYHKPRGSWKLKELWANDGGIPRLPTTDDTEVFVKFEVCEPLLMSPFVFGSGFGKQGFYGVQSMNFQMVMTGGNANRAWRSARYHTNIKTATIVEFEDSQLVFQFITPHASDMLDPRNVVPYYELPIYKTTGFETLPGNSKRGLISDTGTFFEPLVKTLYSSSIQLTCIPDKLIVCVRKNIGGLSCNDTDSYATIKGISINFNNQAGLLSSMTPEQLYRSSLQSGLANMSWDEFSGLAVSCCGSRSATTTNADMRSPFRGVGSNYSGFGGAANPGFKNVPTTGTILVQLCRGHTTDRGVLRSWLSWKL